MKPAAPNLSMDQAAPSAATGILELADALRPALLRASRALRREAQRAGVSALDAQLLGVVKKSPGIGVCALADREQMSRASMSGHVKRLTQAGWVARTAHGDDDRRRSGLALTARGAKALDAIRRRRNDWLAARLARLAPAEREALARAAAPLMLLAEDRP
jgi:DNA-binding MarR family transcriptional regulator